MVIGRGSTIKALGLSTVEEGARAILNLRHIPAVAGRDSLLLRRFTEPDDGFGRGTDGSNSSPSNIHPLLADEIVRRGATLGGLTWHFARPPVQGLDFEMDVRGVAHELVI
jgi:hypothetical protein